MAEKLTPRQWSLYNLLRSEPDRWFTQKEICEAVDGYVYNDEITRHDHCPTIGNDKKIINDNPQVDKIIVMKDNCFKIATYEEYMEERKSHIRRLKSQVAQIQAMDYKAHRDGMGKILNNIFEELKDDNKQFHETFIKESEDGSQN